MKPYFYIIATLLFISCENTHQQKKELQPNTTKIDTNKADKKNKLLINHPNQQSDTYKIKENIQQEKQQQLNINILQFGNKVFKNKSRLISFYIKKYNKKDCGILTYTDSNLSYFNNVKNIGDINGDRKDDAVFVMPPFNDCDQGYSYYFFNKIIPRLSTDSYCCNAENLFSVGDIDEDGFSEICIYYSSCTSRYKSLRVYSLKNDEWKQIGISDFDILTQDPDKIDMSKLVKKTGYKKFKMCNFLEGKKYWEVTKMK